MNRYLIALGSNLDDRLAHLTSACQEIGGRVGDWSVSSVYETEPVGGPEQGPFLNAVMAADSDLGPYEMLDLLQEVESHHGRERAVRWGPRTLDLDIVAWDGPGFAEERLTVPHPRARERAFVLEPLAELWPDADVGGGLTAVDALQRLDRRGVDRLARVWVPSVPRAVPNALIAGQFAVVAIVAILVLTTGSLPERLDPVVILGALSVFAGSVLALWSARLLGAGMTASPVPAPHAELVESGPYRVVRHPIYTGVWLIMLGAAVSFESWPAALAATLLAVYLWLKAGYEERLLRMRFAGYRSYRERVPWRLVPYVT